MWTFITALLAVARSWRQPKHLLLEEHISKMCCTDTMEYYTANRDNEADLHTAAWGDFRNNVKGEK